MSAVTFLGGCAADNEPILTKIISQSVDESINGNVADKNNTSDVQTQAPAQTQVSAAETQPFVVKTDPLNDAQTQAPAAETQIPVQQTQEQTQIAETNPESEKLQEIFDEAHNLELDSTDYMYKSYYPLTSSQYILYSCMGIDGCYNGRLNNGIPNGSGVFWDSYKYIGDNLRPDGSIVVVGIFKDGHLTEGALGNYNGGTYRGQIVNDKPNGLGYFKSDTSSFGGEFSNGDFKTGKLIENGQVYLGQFKNFTANGYGSYGSWPDNINWSAQSSGYYENGKLVRSIELPKKETSNNSGGDASIDYGGGASIDYGGGNSLEEDCTKCHGSGYEQCNKCYGTGEEREWVPGSDLDGRLGVEVDGQYEYVTCKKCYGSKEQPCSACGGSGKK